MIFLTQLWIPIVVSAVLVFAASSLIHMVFKWHNSDYLKIGNEEEVRAVIRSTSPAPGQYVMPYRTDPKQMQAPEIQKKYQEGPMGFLVLKASGAPSMGAPLAMWFVLNLVISTWPPTWRRAPCPPGRVFLPSAAWWAWSLSSRMHAAGCNRPSGWASRGEAPQRRSSTHSSMVS